MNEVLQTNLDRIKTYTLLVAEAMPENDYDFRPVSAVWSFKELIHHIAYSLIWMDEVYILKIKTDWNPPVISASRKEIISYLTRAFSTVEGDLSKVVNDETSAGFWLMIEHNAHHRGQAVTYLRCKGITPPEFPF